MSVLSFSICSCLGFMSFSWMTCMCAYANICMWIYMFLWECRWTCLLRRIFVTWTPCSWVIFLNLLLLGLILFLRFWVCRLNQQLAKLLLEIRKLEINSYIFFSDESKVDGQCLTVNSRFLKYESYRRLCLPHSRLKGTLDLLVPQAVDQWIQHGDDHGIEHGRHFVCAHGVAGAGL